MSAIGELISGMAGGREWNLMGDADGVRTLLGRVYNERCHKASHYKDRFQVRVNLQKKDDAASYAGWITAENPTSGPYQGTSFVWFPGEEGSVAVLVIGTDGFGADTAILGRPGHARRLRALSRLHRGRIWVKPDLLDVTTEVPAVVAQKWPQIPAAIKAYGRVIYAAAAVRSESDRLVVEDLLDLFFHEHGTPLTGPAKGRWDGRLQAIAGAVFPPVTQEEVLAILRERRFVVLEGPPGTGKTRLAYRIADQVGRATHVQFHAARTYEDFVVGLFPRPTGEGLAFDVRPGDLLVANAAAAARLDPPHGFRVGGAGRRSHDMGRRGTGLRRRAKSRRAGLGPVDRRRLGGVGRRVRRGARRAARHDRHSLPDRAPSAPLGRARAVDGGAGSGRRTAAPRTRGLG